MEQKDIKWKPMTPLPQSLLLKKWVFVNMIHESLKKKKTKLQRHTCAWLPINSLVLELIEQSQKAEQSPASHVITFTLPWFSK